MPGERQLPAASQSIQTAGPLEDIGTFRGKAVHLTGIKGTGVAAIAEILAGEGARITGSDGAETFFTDELLRRIGIVPQVGFSADHVPSDADLLVYSAAYGPENPERREALRRGVPQLSYAEILGMLSRRSISLGVGGVHGKTSTTAMLGTMLVGTGLPVTVVVGSGVPSFGGSATLRQGQDLLIAETCEYRRHFLHFSPTVAIITSVESDHQDYYRDDQDILSAFEEYARGIRREGALVYCSDDSGASEIAKRIAPARPDISLVPYGFDTDGPWRCKRTAVRDGVQYFTIGDGPGLWELHVPGRHMVANAAGACAALSELVSRYGQTTAPAKVHREGLAHFRGTRRRSEVVARVRGITVIDDYAHHPTAVSRTLEGYREFYPGRRLIVDFMSHTYSRTAALLDEFARSFDGADMVVLNDIYASAREENREEITGETFHRAVAEHHARVFYCPSFEEATRFLLDELKEGDVLITMGAGDNFRVGRRVVDALNEAIPGDAYA